MKLTRLRVSHFRNLRNEQVLLNRRITVFNGDNAQGKTNLIEAIGLLGSLRSFRTARAQDLIETGFPSGEIEGWVRHREVDVSLRVTLEKGARKAFLDDCRPETAEQYLSVFPCVLFTPWDLELSLGSQELRRAYADRAAFVQSGVHVSLLKRYDRVLRQRNALLREPTSDLSVWNQHLAELGTSIRLARLRVLGELAKVVATVHEGVSGGTETIAVKWEGKAFKDEPNVGQFLSELTENQENDRRTGHTTSGPHRDRLRLDLCGRDVRVHASRGQHRTVALSLKIAFLQWSSETLGQTPVFLLDDPGSELDAQRLSFVGSFLSKWPGQIVIACTPEANFVFDKNTEVDYFRVTNGYVERTA